MAEWVAKVFNDLFIKLEQIDSKNSNLLFSKISILFHLLVHNLCGWICIFQSRYALTYLENLGLHQLFRSSLDRDLHIAADVPDL